MTDDLLDRIPDAVWDVEGVLRTRRRPYGRCTAGHRLTRATVRAWEDRGRVRWGCGVCMQGRPDPVSTRRGIYVASAATAVPDAPALDRHWRSEAPCRDEDPELFFPVGNSGPALAQLAEAKAVCRRCPVVSACLSWAQETGQDHGVWGGLSEDERRTAKRRRRGAAA